jgi:hypothetical protein
MAENTPARIPSSLTIRIEFEMPSDYADSAYTSFQEFLDDARAAAIAQFEDDLFNIINSADVFDENGELVAGDRYMFED